MSIFGKKSDNNVNLEPEAGKPQGGGAGAAAVAPSSSSSPSPAYGIAETIQLMRSLPLDQGAQNVDLVVRVVRTTLASLNVRVQDIIEDASRKQKHIQDGIAALHGQVAELERHLEGKRREIQVHEADLKETTGVKERLLQTERTAGHAPPPTPPGTTGPGLFSPLPSPPPSSRPPLPRPNDRPTNDRPSNDREDSGGHGKPG